MIKNFQNPEKAILVEGIFLPVNQGKEPQGEEETLEELENLCKTLGIKVIAKFVQKLKKINPDVYIGSGKLDEILSFAKNNNATLIVFNNDLSPSQISNIEKKGGIKVIDRTTLILEIFAKRARTSEAKIQVELAQYQYLMPRLVHYWTHLHRQRGGIGTRGPGEKELETDKRLIKKRISFLKKQLAKINTTRIIQRTNREGLLKCAIVGYTNAGKSSLFNVLTKGNAYVEDLLFATLDTYIKKKVINGIPILFIDTIGFIRKLPHHLINAFKAVLAEIKEADFLIHVLDVSSPYYSRQYETTKQILFEIQQEVKPTILVLNKIDKINILQENEFDFTKWNAINIETLVDYYKNEKSESRVVPFSCLTLSNIDLLKQNIFEIACELIKKRNYAFSSFGE